MAAWPAFVTRGQRETLIDVRDVAYLHRAKIPASVMDSHSTRLSEVRDG